MNKMFVALGIGAAAVALPLAIAAYRPDTFHVQRSVVVDAPAARLQPLISDMHAFNTWNPFNQKDPNVRGEYRGPPSGPGAQYLFAGNSDVGTGSITVVDASPSRVAMKLEMTEPMSTHNHVEFLLQPQGAGTQVTWSMQGRQPYVAKVIGLFLDMDGMVGGEFEKGLAQLKSRAEKA
jgi:hypothetical protein